MTDEETPEYPLPSPDTWRYNPSPGQWHLDRPPTQHEAVFMAAQCATASADNLLPIDVAISRAESAKAWAAIAAVAPENTMLVAGFTPPPVPAEARPRVFIGTCDDGVTAIRIGADGNWLHLGGFIRCFNPPPDGVHEVPPDGY